MHIAILFLIMRIRTYLSFFIALLVEDFDAVVTICQSKSETRLSLSPFLLLGEIPLALVFLSKNKRP